MYETNCLSKVSGFLFGVWVRWLRAGAPDNANLFRKCRGQSPAGRGNVWETYGKHRKSRIVERGSLNTTARTDYTVSRSIFPRLEVAGVSVQTVVVVEEEG